MVQIHELNKSRRDHQGKEFVKKRRDAQSTKNSITSEQYALHTWV